MNLLALVQSLHYEAKLAGSAPSGTAGLSGRSADLLRWVIEAYNDIQRQADGKWKWLRGEWKFDTVADTQSYAPAVVKDIDTDAIITRFRAWDLDDREPPLIYLLADGKKTERELAVKEWRDFRYLYVRGTHSSAYTGAIATKVDDKLFLGPTPDDVYHVTGTYWQSNQELVVDADIPEMPDDYHMAIVYRAIVKYGYNSVSPEILARAEMDGAPIYEALANNQSYGRFSLSTAPPLA